MRLRMEEKSDYRRVLLVTCMSAGMVPFMGSALNLAVPQISSDFSMDALESIWIMASYMLSCAIFQIPCARLADMFGRVRVFKLGMLLFCSGTLLNAFAFSGLSMIVFRFLCGLGSAMVFGTNVAILTASVPKSRRGWALGLNSGAVYFGLSAGPVLGGFLAEVFGWRSIFVTAALWSLAVLAGAFLFIRDEWFGDSGKGFDAFGSAVFAAGLSMIIYGFSELPHARGFSLLLAGMAVVVFFVWYERRQKVPVFNVGVFFKNRVFRYSMFAVLVNYSATISIAYMLGLYLQHVRGLGPSRAALVIVVQSLVMAMVSLQSGRLSDRFSATKMASWGMALTAFGLLLLGFVGAGTPYWVICGMLALVGLGFGLFSSPNMNVIMSSVSTSEYAFAGAATGTIRLVGQAFSMGIAFMTTSFFVGGRMLTADVHAEFIHAMRAAFFIGAALCALGIYASSVRGKSPGNGGS